MTLLQNYLGAVRTFLPRSTDQQDILTEISEHLQTKFDEREEELCRSLTEDEQAAVLSAYGNPMEVASRYGATNLGLSFGRQLIGPEVFVLYRYILLTQFTLTILVVTAIRIAGGMPGSFPGRYLSPMLMQFVLTTTIFIAIDAFKRRSRSRVGWSFPPPYMQLVPRWQSMSGFIVLSVCALWWSLIPFAPFLLLGPAAGRVQLTPAWHAFYWPVLVPLLAGAAQRLITYARPELAWLQALTRVITNGWSVALVYPFLLASPYVASITGADGEALASRLNAAFWWNAMASFGLYWLISAAFNGYLCYQHVKHASRRRRDHRILQQS